MLKSPSEKATDVYVCKLNKEFVSDFDLCPKIRPGPWGQYIPHRSEMYDYSNYDKRLHETTEKETPT